MNNTSTSPDRFSPWGLAASGTEHSEQVALMAWAGRAAWVGVDACATPELWASTKVSTLALKALPELDWLYAVPNGGERNRAVAAAMKMEGVKRGVPDLFWPIRLSCPTCVPSVRCGLYIEMKRKRGKAFDLSEHQLAFREHALSQDYAWCWCPGWEIARDRIIAYARGEWKEEYEAL